MRQLLVNARASALGRRAASTGIVMITVALMGSLLTLVIPLRDGRDNLVAHYDRSGWRDTWLLDGIDSSAPAVARERAALGAVHGVTSVRTIYAAPALVGDTPLQVQTFDPVHAQDVVVGRVPIDGRCESVASRDLEGVRIGETVTVTFDAAGPARGSLTTRVVGLIARGDPLLSDTLLTTCNLAVRGVEPSGLLVTTRPGTTIPADLGAHRLSTIARDSLSATSGSGMLAMVTLLLALVALAVTTSVGRWAVRSRRSEFACLRLWGFRRAALMGQVALEMLLLWAVAAPVGMTLGGVLAWQYMRRVGGSVDPGAGLWVAIPSLSTVGLVAGGLLTALLVFSVVPTATAVRPSVAELLRRSGE